MEILGRFIMGILGVIFAILTIAEPLAAQYLLATGPQWLRTTSIGPDGFWFTAFLSFIGLLATTVGCFILAFPDKPCSK